MHSDEQEPLCVMSRTKSKPRWFLGMLVITDQTLTDNNFVTTGARALKYRPGVSDEHKAKQQKTTKQKPPGKKSVDLSRLTAVQPIVALGAIGMPHSL